MTPLLGTTTSPTAYWYLSRGTGVVALILLTVAVVLGVLDSQRFTSPLWPRFAVDRVHRDVSLLVLVVLVIHIVTSVLDGFAPITLTDGVIPFLSPYRPLWLGLGALSFDILIAVAVTSVMRRRLGYQTWRAIHWAAYGSWPIAVFHGLGTGSDIKQGWMLVLTVLCVAAVIGAVVVRTLRVASGAATLRGLWLGLAGVTPIALAVFTVVGPLAPHWASRAGTPSSVLLKAHRIAAAPRVAVAVHQSGPVRHSAPASDHIPVPFTAQLTGTVVQTQEPGGALVDLIMQCRGQIHGEMRVRLAGQPVDGGGLSMTGSDVQLTAVGLTSVLRGKIISLQGQEFLARVRNSSGTTLQLHANLNIDPNSGAVTGTLTAGAA